MFERGVQRVYFAPIGSGLAAVAEIRQGAEVQRWSDRYAEQADDADNTDALSYDGFCELNEWRDARSFDSAHLVGGPRIGCFRLNDKIKIVWTSDAPVRELLRMAILLYRYGAQVCGYSS